jgi:opacity protein-like surface antigen
MKRLLTCLLLLGMSVAVLAEPEASKDKSANFSVPWKSSQHQAYRDKNSFAWKQGGGYFVNDFFGVEGSVYKFNYHEKFRYNPHERKGFVQPEEYTVNVLGIGKVPLNDYIALFGKVGPAIYQNRFDTETSNDPLYNSMGNDPSQLGVTYSTGARLALTPSLEFSLEYMNTQNDNVELEGTMAQMNWNF